MSEGPNSGFDTTNPKAAAKAAKAYGKASRPWWKKKRWWLLAIIVVIVIIIVTTTAGGSNGPTAVNDGGTSSGTGNATTSGGGTAKSGPGTKSNPAKVGQTILLAGTQYTVLSVKTATNIGGQYGQKCDGTCVIVKLKIENKKNETKTFLDSNSAFIAKDGTSYDPSDNGIYLDDALILEQMQPNLPHTGEIAFDVPPKVVKRGVLKVSDLWGDGDAYFATGLS